MENLLQLIFQGDTMIKLLEKSYFNFYFLFISLLSATYVGIKLKPSITLKSAIVFLIWSFLLMVSALIIHRADQYFTMNVMENIDKRMFYSTSLIVILLAFFRSINTLSPFNFTQYSFNYQNAFLKRGLLGEMLRQLNIEPSYDVISVIANLQASFLMILLIIVFSSLLRKKTNEIGLWLFFFIIIAHPATYQSFHYDLGRADSLCIVFTILSLVLIKIRANTVCCYLLIPCFLGISLLFHEAAFFFSIPFVMAYWFYIDPHRNRRISKVLVFMFLLILTFLISTQGSVKNQSFSVHLADLQGKYGDKVSEDGLMVLYRNFSDNLKYTVNKSFTLSKLVYHLTFFIFMWPLGILLYRIIKRDIHSSRYNILRIIFIISAFSPLLLYPIGHDHFRWWSIAITNLFITFCFLGHENHQFLKNISEVFFKYKRLAFLTLILGLIAGPLRAAYAFDLFSISKSIIDFVFSSKVI
jgi:hypothetical protein